MTTDAAEEFLLREGYIERRWEETRSTLVPTEKGWRVIDELRRRGELPTLTKREEPGEIVPYPRLAPGPYSGTAALRRITPEEAREYLKSIRDHLLQLKGDLARLAASADVDAETLRTLARVEGDILPLACGAIARAPLFVDTRRAPAGWP